MKSLNDILNETPQEYSDEDLQSSILEAADTSPVKVEKPAEADKVTKAMANLSDMVTMADEIYYTLSDLEEIEEELVGKIETIFASLDELYKEVDETYDIAVPDMGPTEVEEAEEIIGQSLDSILNETTDKGDSGTLIPLKAGKFNKRSLIRTMRKPEGVIQTSGGNQFTIYHPIDQSDIWHDKSVFATDKDGGEVEVNYDDITSYSETYDENDTAVVRSMTYDGMEMPKTKMGILTAMKRELRSMKVADLKASYQYIKAAHCNTKEGMDGMGTKKDMLTAMMKDLRGMKMHDLKASYGYIKAAHCGPQEGAHEDEMVNASSCTSESSDLSEAIDFSKVPDDHLIAWLKRFRTVLTKAGLPLKVDRYVKGNPWSDFKKDMAAAEREAENRGLKVEGVELEEAIDLGVEELDEAIDFSKLTDEGLLSWIPWARYQTKTKTPVQLSKQTNTGDFKKDLTNAEKEAKKRGLRVEGVELDEATELYKKGKISFTRFSYGTGKGVGLQINNGMNFIQFREEDIKVLMNGLKAITQSNGLLKKEEVSLDEMKTKDDDLAVMIYDFIGADTEGLPLKTLIHQAVGKYFGSQKDKKKVKP